VTSGRDSRNWEDAIVNIGLRGKFKVLWRLAWVGKVFGAEEGVVEIYGQVVARLPLVLTLLLEEAHGLTNFREGETYHEI